MSEFTVALGTWLAVLGCAHCQGTLHLDGERLICRACDTAFPIGKQVLSLVRNQDHAAFAAFQRAYREARLRDGWQPMAPDQALALPFRSPPGYPPLYWRVRRQSYRKLVHHLSRRGPPPAAGPVADLGAGTGWLGFRLAQAGYRVLAVDASTDDAFGLGAARPYVAAAGERLLLAQASLEHPPLRKEQWRLVIFNASLHYAQDLPETLVRAACALHSGGSLIVLDTPISRRPVPGTGRGDRHLGRDELDDALTRAGLSTRWLSLARGIDWWAFCIQAYLKGDPTFAFPMIVADRS